MSDLGDIMDEMGNALRTAFDASDLTIQVEPRMNWNPTPPSVDIYPGDPFREGIASSFGDRGEVFFTVRARADTADNLAGQEDLLALMDDVGAVSVADILETDQTLNGKATSIKIDGPSPFGVFGAPDNAGALLGVTWRAMVLPART